MGTRNLTCVYKDGKHRVAQYGQWDGYPKGQGKTILEILKKDDNLKKLEKNIEYCKFVKRETIGKFYDKCFEENNEKKFDEKYPSVDRDLGGEILNLIINSKDKKILLMDSIDFAKDSLFCEFCYVIDFDARTFEVYKGFNQQPLRDTERFYFFDGKPENGYYPIKLIKTYNLDKLPSVTKFLKDLEKILGEDE